MMCPAALENVKSLEFEKRHQNLNKALNKLKKYLYHGTHAWIFLNIRKTAG